MNYDRNEPHRDYAMHWGLVQDNVDPLGEGRVRVMVPGFLEPAMFAPVVMPGAPFNSGAYTPPAIGCQVLVGFIHGDLAQPVVFGSIVPPRQADGFRAQVPPADLPKFQTFENEEFIIMLGHSSTAAPYCTIRTRTEPHVSITLDVTTRMVDISGPSAVRLRSDAMISLEAPLIALGNRTVIQNGKPI